MREVRLHQRARREIARTRSQRLVVGPGPRPDRRASAQSRCPGIAVGEAGATVGHQEAIIDHHHRGMVDLPPIPRGRVAGHQHRLRVDLPRPVWRRCCGAPHDGAVGGWPAVRSPYIVQLPSGCRSTDDGTGPGRPSSSASTPPNEASSAAVQVRASGEVKCAIRGCSSASVTHISGIEVVTLLRRRWRRPRAARWPPPRRARSPVRRPTTA